MHDLKSKEAILMKVRRLSVYVFYTLLIGGIAMIGIGASNGIIQYLIDGAVFLVTSPIFFVMNQIAKQKMKELGV